VGIGIYQGLEFVLQRSSWEVLSKGGLAASRLRNAVAMVQNAQAFEFVLGRDRQRNRMELLNLLRR
jgi:hypothetical protein